MNGPALAFILALFCLGAGDHFEIKFELSRYGYIFTKELPFKNLYELYFCSEVQLPYKFSIFLPCQLLDSCPNEFALSYKALIGDQDFIVVYSQRARARTDKGNLGVVCIQYRACLGYSLGSGYHGAVSGCLQGIKAAVCISSMLTLLGFFCECNPFSHPLLLIY